MGLLGKWTPAIVPRVMAFNVFVAGSILLFSGATPAAAGRMALLRRVLPLPLVEMSHFVGSLIGVLLLLLARGLQRRIESAYYLTIILLCGGIVASLLKGFDVEEAGILAAMLVVFIPCRRDFYRKGALLTERFTLQWLMAILGVIACTVWLMLFAFKHVDYQDELWWRFEFSRDAPRALRALAGVVIVTLIALSSRVLRSRARLGALPTDQDIADARRIVMQSTKTASHLALLGDKRLLFNSARDAFIMYGDAGRSYVAMGDPVGSKVAAADLAWDFRELCDVGGRAPVFYQVDEEMVSMYVEMGLSLIKIGEEARVRLTDFGLEGGNRKNLRRTHRQLNEAGCRFEIIQPPAVADMMPTLKQISDAWLADKSTAEKGFSLGFFKPDYIEQTPVAIIWHEEKIVAFANLWFGADKEELSLDLMRYTPGSPHGVMEYLFINLMLWGRENGYQWFSLGMRLWRGSNPSRADRSGTKSQRWPFAMENTSTIFRAYDCTKTSLIPCGAKYVASPGGLSLPVYLTNVATLISGGLSGLIRK